MVSLIDDVSGILSRGASQLRKKFTPSKPKSDEPVTIEKKQKTLSWRKRRENKRRASDSSVSTASTVSSSSSITTTTTAPSVVESPDTSTENLSVEEPQEGLEIVQQKPEQRTVYSKDVIFYFHKYYVPDATRDVFTQHGIVNKLLEAHVKRIQDKAWEIFPYPCIGVFEFIKFNLPVYQAFPQLMSLMRAGGIYLDVGCCVGQDIRYLATQGVPVENIFGADLEQKFIDLGYELFMDRETLGRRATIKPANIFDADSWIVNEMTERCAVVHAGYFLHLFDRKKQLEAATRLASCLEKKPGNMILGRSVGSTVPGHYEHPVVGTMMRHDVPSLEEFWAEVGENIGCKFAVDVDVNYSTVRMSSDGTKKFDHPAEDKAIELTFCITML